jgi:tyrosine-protein kinase Etk/Wzc
MQKTNHKKKEEPEENLIQQMVANYLPYWPLFLLAIALGLAGAFFYIRYKVPLYQASATLIIKDEKKGTEESKLTESLNTISSKQLVENEIEVIQSRSLMDSVVRQQHLYAPIFEKGKIHKTSAYLRSPVQIQAYNPDSIKEVKDVVFTYNQAKGLVEMDKSTYKINEFINTAFGRLKFVPNKYFNAINGIPDELYFSLISPKNVTTALLENLEVTAASKLSTIIELKFKAEVPEKAENILNGLVKAYDLAGLKTKNDLARNTLEFVEDRLSTIGRQMDSIQKKVQQYKSGAGAVDIGTQGQLFLQNVSDNDQKLSTVNTQMSVLNQVENFVTSKDKGGAIVPSTLGVSDPMLSQLLDKLYTTELEHEKLRKTVGENNPKLVSITDQINKIRPNILENIRSQKQSLSATRQNLSSTNGAYNSMLRSMPVKEKALLDLTRDQTTLNGVYQFLLQKREESILSFSSTISDNRIVDNAQAGNVAVSPNKKVIYAAAVLALLFISLFFITVRESFTGKIMYRREIEELTHVPIIAEIAHDNTNKPIIVEPGKRTYGTEEFRKIRVSLSYVGVDATHKKILVTSSISGEGKSFIAVNLAISIASTGKKVVLVDMDLNNPTIGKILALNQEVGVSDFLMGHKKPEQIVGNVRAFDNLFYISAGTPVDGPSELMVNGKVPELISYLDKNFDMVVIDTSPVVLVTDAYLLSALCNTTLYVVRHKYTPKMIIKRMDDNNTINPLHNTAIIFNGVKGRGFFKNSYGHGYGYGYVYGYNKEDKKNKKTIV